MLLVAENRAVPLLMLLFEVPLLMLSAGKKQYKLQKYISLSFLVLLLNHHVLSRTVKQMRKLQSTHHLSLYLGHE